MPASFISRFFTMISTYMPEPAPANQFRGIYIYIYHSAVFSMSSSWVNDRAESTGGDNQESMKVINVLAQQEKKQLFCKELLLLFQ